MLIRFCTFDSYNAPIKGHTQKKEELLKEEHEDEFYVEKNLLYCKICS